MNTETGEIYDQKAMSTRDFELAVKKADTRRFAKTMRFLEEQVMDWMVCFHYEEDVCESHGEVEDVFV